MKLLNVDHNAKTVKGQKKGFLTGILYLAPAKLSGYEVCPMRTKGCTDACLNTAGRGAMSTTQKARIRKTKWFFEDRASFMLQLEKDIKLLTKQAKKKGMIPTVRLNGTSDIVWYKIPFTSESGENYKNLMERFPHIQFYDYTKRPNHRNIPKNYHLTFSLAENNDENAKKALNNKLRLAVVFRDENLPKTFWGRRVIDGDETDLRFLDKGGMVIGLKAKGKAKKDTTGFVRDVT